MSEQVEQELAPAEELRVLQEEISNLRQLNASRGWKYLISYAQEQFELKLNQIVAHRVRGLDEAFAQEFMKGEVSGIQIFTNLLETRLETCETAAKELLKDIDENEQANQQNSDARGR